MPSPRVNLSSSSSSGGNNSSEKKAPQELNKKLQETECSAALVEFKVCSEELEPRENNKDIYAVRTLLNNKVIAAAWVQKLEFAGAATEEERLQRLNYLKLLLFVLQRGRLSGIFRKQPPHGPLQPLPQGLSLLDLGNLMLDQDDSQDYGGGDARSMPYTIEVSNDLREFVASQEVPNFGIQMYYAWSSDEPIHKWSSFEEDKFPKYILDKIKQLKEMKSDDKNALARNICGNKRNCDVGLPDRFSKKKVKSPQEIERSQGRSFHAYVGLMGRMGNFDKCEEEQAMMRYQRPNQGRGRNAGRMRCRDNAGEAEDVAAQEDFGNAGNCLDAGNRGARAVSPCTCRPPAYLENRPAGGLQPFEGQQRPALNRQGNVRRNHADNEGCNAGYAYGAANQEGNLQGQCIDNQGYANFPGQRGGRARNGSPNRANRCAAQEGGINRQDPCNYPPCTCPCPRVAPEMQNPAQGCAAPPPAGRICANAPGAVARPPVPDLCVEEGGGGALAPAPPPAGPLPPADPCAQRAPRLDIPAAGALIAAGPAQPAQDNNANIEDDLEFGRRCYEAFYNRIRQRNERRCNAPYGGAPFPLPEFPGPARRFGGARGAPCVPQNAAGFRRPCAPAIGENLLPGGIPPQQQQQPCQPQEPQQQPCQPQEQLQQPLQPQEQLQQPCQPQEQVQQPCQPQEQIQAPIVQPCQPQEQLQQSVQQQQLQQSQLQRSQQQQLQQSQLQRSQQQPLQQSQLQRSQQQQLQQSQLQRSQQQQLQQSQLQRSQQQQLQQSQLQRSQQQQQMQRSQQLQPMQQPLQLQQQPLQLQQQPMQQQPLQLQQQPMQQQPLQLQQQPMQQQPLQMQPMQQQPLQQQPMQQQPLQMQPMQQQPLQQQPMQQQPLQMQQQALQLQPVQLQQQPMDLVPRQYPQNYAEAQDPQNRIGLACRPPQMAPRTTAYTPPYCGPSTSAAPGGYEPGTRIRQMINVLRQKRDEHAQRCLPGAPNIPGDGGFGPANLQPQNQIQGRPVVRPQDESWNRPGPSGVVFPRRINQQPAQQPANTGLQYGGGRNAAQNYDAGLAAGEGNCEVQEGGAQVAGAAPGAEACPQEIPQVVCIPECIVTEDDADNAAGAQGAAAAPLEAEDVTLHNPDATVHHLHAPPQQGFYLNDLTPRSANFYFDHSFGTHRQRLYSTAMEDVEHSFREIFSQIMSDISAEADNVYNVTPYPMR